MFQKDFILRMMEMMAEMIAIFLGLIKKGDTEQAARCLDKAYRDILKQDAAFFQKIPTTELTRQLIEEHHYTNGHLKILSELFFAEGELRRAQKKDPKAYEFYKKALILFEFVEKEAATFSLEREERGWLLKNRLEELKLKDTTK